MMRIISDFRALQYYRAGAGLPRPPGWLSRIRHGVLVAEGDERAGGVGDLHREGVDVARLAARADRRAHDELAVGRR